jgi:hypothetical protein
LPRRVRWVGGPVERLRKNVRDGRNNVAMVIEAMVKRGGAEAVFFGLHRLIPHHLSTL